jgi:hypothetical protein
VKGDTVDVVVVAHINPQRIDVICRPQTSRPVVGASEEIVTMRAPLQIPNRVIMASVRYQT